MSDDEIEVVKIMLPAHWKQTTNPDEALERRVENKAASEVFKAHGYTRKAFRVDVLAFATAPPHRVLWSRIIERGKMRRLA